MVTESKPYDGLDHDITGPLDAAELADFRELQQQYNNLSPNEFILSNAGIKSATSFDRYTRLYRRASANGQVQKPPAREDVMFNTIYDGVLNLKPKVRQPELDKETRQQMIFLQLLAKLGELGLEDARKPVLAVFFEAASEAVRAQYIENLQRLVVFHQDGAVAVTRSDLRLNSLAPKGFVVEHKVHALTDHGALLIIDEVANDTRTDTRVHYKSPGSNAYVGSAQSKLVEYGKPFPMQSETDRVRKVIKAARPLIFILDLSEMSRQSE